VIVEDGASSTIISQYYKVAPYMCGFYFVSWAFSIEYSQTCMLVRNCAEAATE
jgi:hypothetical protein